MKQSAVRTPVRSVAHRVPCPPAACDNEHPLVDKTRVLLNKYAAENGFYNASRLLDCPHDWLRSFAKGHIASPGASRLLNVYEVLSGKRVSC